MIVTDIVRNTGQEERLAPVDSAQLIRQDLLRANIAYGPEHDPRLWEIDPRYFILERKNYEQMEDFAAVMPQVIAAINTLMGGESVWNPHLPYYFRFDSTLTAKTDTQQGGQLKVLEIQNEVPVEDATVSVIRSVYDRHLSPPSGENPFRGSIAGIAQALRSGWGENCRVGIVIPENRQYYTRDYTTGASMLSDLGVDTQVVRSEELQREQGGLVMPTGDRLDVIYRGFREIDLKNGQVANGERIKDAIDAGVIGLFPQFSPALVDKRALALFFDPQQEERLIEILGPQGEEISTMVKKYIPETYIAHPDFAVYSKGRRLSWWGDVMSDDFAKQGWVVKPAFSFGAKDVHASTGFKDSKRWREHVGNSLLEGINDVYSQVVLQRMVTGKRYSVQTERDGEMVTTPDNGLRLSVTCIVDNGQAEIIDVDACLRQGTRVHGSTDAALRPVVVRR